MSFIGWLSGFSYRKSHVINHATGAGTNYQVKIKVHYGSGTDGGENVYCNSKCRTDFGDVRFTDDDGTTLLDYWMEEKVDSDYAIFWVEVADDLSSSNVAIYIYYGNPSATTTSDGESTFIFFDDFLGTTLDATKWTEDAVNNITHTINNYFRFEDATKSGGTYWIYNGTDTGSQHQAKVTLPTDFRVLFTSKISDTSANQMGEGGVAIIAGDNTIIAYANHQDRFGASLDPEKDVVAENTPTNIATGWTLHATRPLIFKDVSSGDRTKYDMRKYGSTIRVYDETGHICDISISSTVSKIALTAGAYGGYPYLDYVQVDYVAVAKYVDPPPSHGAWGSEEVVPAMRKLKSRGGDARSRIWFKPSMKLGFTPWSQRFPALAPLKI